MRHFLTNILAIVILLLATGCSERIEIHTRSEEPKLVIYGALSDMYDTQFITISRSSGYFASATNGYVPVENAWLTSSDGQSTKLLRLTTALDTYTGIIQIRQGVEYTLTLDADVDMDGIMETYRVSTGPVLPPVALMSISVERMKLLILNGYGLSMTFNDPPEKNYYIYMLSVNGNLKTQTLSSFYTSTDELYNGKYQEKQFFNFFQDYNHYITWSDDGDTGENEILFKEGDDVTLYKCNATEGYYNFVRQSQKGLGPSNPMFGGPNSNIASNIPGGLGYFTAFCVSSARTMVPYDSDEPVPLGY